MTHGKISSNGTFFCDYCGGNIQSDNPPTVEIKKEKRLQFCSEKCWHDWILKQGSKNNRGSFPDTRNIFFR
jgi:hypothetical protein